MTTPRGKRTFTCAVHNAIRLVHDPLTGLTHRADELIPLGRSLLPEDEVEQWPTVLPGQLDPTLPLSVCWSPLVRCNLSCSHCLDDTTVPELHRTARQNIANILAKSDVLGVDISGGEPLLLRDLNDLVGRLIKGGGVVSVTTNGWHLPRKVDSLAGTVDAIRISLDGADATTHDRWRGSGSFERAIAGAKAAITKGIPTQLQTVLMATTRHASQSVVDLAAHLGAHGVTFLQMLPFGEAATLADTEQITDEAAHSVVDSLNVPSGITARLRTRSAAAGFTVIRADGRIWRNGTRAEHIDALHPLREPSDLALTGPDGSP